jgi:ABC-type dipeptide/oligopeptide/nickel transport system permease component
MGRYLAVRLLRAIAVTLAVLIAVFVIINVTGDPVALLMPEDATDEEIREMRHILGFDRPMHVRVAEYVISAARGDFGESLRFAGEPALGLVLERLPATVTLAIAAMAWSLPLSFALGAVAALRRRSIAASFATVLALLGQSIPNFWLGIMLIMTFSVRLRLLPTFGQNGIRHLILPAITLGFFPLARTSRLVRSMLLEVMSQDYIRTARAKGLSERAVLISHAMKNALIPVVTMLGVQVGFLIGGAVVVENVFAWPGLGRLAVQSIFYRDFPVVQADVFVVATMFVVSNLFVDILYGWLDPRVRIAAPS